MSDPNSAAESLRHKKSHIREVAFDQTYVDARFQRIVNPTAVTKIENEFHPAGVGHLLLAAVTEADGSRQQPGKYAVVDGQTRWHAMQALHQAPEPIPDLPQSVTAEVFEDLTVAEAALLFRLRNAQRPIPPADRDRIAVTEGDPTMVQVVKQAEAAGYVVYADEPEDRTLPQSCITVAKRIVSWGRKYSRPDLLAEALNIQAQAYGTKLGDVDPQILAATADLLRKNSNLVEEEFAMVLSQLGQSGLLALGKVEGDKVGKRMHGGLQIVLCAAYNKKGGKRGGEKITLR